jgi:hypothetical protein
MFCGIYTERPPAIHRIFQICPELEWLLYELFFALIYFHAAFQSHLLFITVFDQFEWKTTAIKRNMLRVTPTKRPSIWNLKRTITTSNTTSSISS